MFPVIINDGQTPFPDADIYYIVAKEGIFLRKNLGVMDSVAPVKNISILQSVQTAARMNISKIPAKYAQQIINFFKAVYHEHASEAIVLLFYNKDTKKHKIICPTQEVSAAAADYSKAITIEGYDMIGTIHSHASMSAFHSGVDDADEKSFDGLHITFGHMRDDDISISASIVANGHRVIVDPRDYINNLIMTVDINEEVKVPYATTYKWDKEKNQMVALKTGRYYLQRKFDQRYQVKLAKDPGVPSGWLSKVTKKSYVSYGHHGKWYGYGVHYDGNYWDGWVGHNNINNNRVCPTRHTSIVPAHTTTPVKKVTTKKRITPCDDCNFKSHKINMMLESLDDVSKKAILAWAIEELENNAKTKLAESVGADELSYYYCYGCGESFSFDETEEASACCPVCETADNLMEITATDMLSYIEEDEEDDKDDLEEDLRPKNAMITCPVCASSFSKDFLNDGCCPTCRNEIAEEVGNTIKVDGCLECPVCGKYESAVDLAVDAHCQYCGHKFSRAKINQVLIEYDVEPIMDTPDTEIVDQTESAKKAMEAAAEADKTVEKIPIPESRTGFAEKFFKMLGKGKDN